ncbi:hypothetical protein LEP1GSC021_4931 [Leptospira noguchii str. 1993005606]|uniref:Uncharacterized protein n=2 Tax=Leptospira noguchii TaxID=28182 RepID=M6Y5L6_9LEPT|nr:hypothetical protein LEP1GSC035_3230 [Leptospira noguchii str. 2007001578]EMO89622.1 hypothetical protein LEP1GSC024_2168 [Leptospira noguchii str. 2001034031]EPE81700.1 hypothetical protein LEP1GSC021_4931 [Leptospira noguchii str. 1993005606]
MVLCNKIAEGLDTRYIGVSVLLSSILILKSYSTCGVGYRFFSVILFLIRSI